MLFPIYWPHNTFLLEQQYYVFDFALQRVYEQKKQLCTFQ